MNNSKITGTTINFSTGYSTDYVYSKKILKLIEEGIDIKQEKISVLCATLKLANSLISKIFKDFLVQYMDIDRGVITEKDTGFHIKFRIDNKTIKFVVVGNEEFLSEQLNNIKDYFQLAGSYIKWWYSEKAYTMVQLDTSMLPVDSFYPFLNGESLEDYYQRYLDSTASILLLIGPPGTGKSSFIKGLIDYSRSSAVVTYDPCLLQHDAVFVDFISDSDTDFLVLEDSDNFLSSRSEGNSMMDRFLNVSDGLVSTKNKKIIFSTNLPSVRDVDDALIRPGRCFGVVEFAKLNQQQAHALAGDFNIEIINKQDFYTIAEVFHSSATKAVKKNFGFNAS
ncbi:AAA family ATPase [Candidatus Dojkabacteria bacterium]|jgi:hypothetical protein|nr:AAA family ATPase [Candidatus Dojkabacteria bacterium]